MRRLVSVLCLAIFYSFSSMLAQTPTAAVSGIVNDSQGALVEGAEVEVTSTTQSTTREGVTNSDGSYSIPNLLPGEYRVQVSSKGFAIVQYTSVVLEAGRIFTLDATLSPTGQTTTVNVTAAAQTVDLEQSMLQGQVTAKTIAAFPSMAATSLNLPI